MMALTASNPITKVMSQTGKWVLTALVTKFLFIDTLLPNRFTSGPEPQVPSLAHVLRITKEILTGEAELDRSDELILQLLIGAVTGYLLMGFLCLVMDLSLPVKVRIAMKAQGEGSRPLKCQEWLQAFALSMRNLLFIAPPFACMLFYLPLRNGESWHTASRRKWFETRAGGPGTAAVLRIPGMDQFDFRAELLNLLIHAIIVETVFYWTHRMFHYGSLYRMIHKKHHRFTAPVSVASVYAHWAEFLLNNFAGIVLGPFVSNCHPVHAFFWLCFALVATGGAHSGYYCLDGKGHDCHHELFNCNFGVLRVFDSICKTRDVDLHPKKMAERRTAEMNGVPITVAARSEAASKKDS